MQSTVVSQRALSLQPARCHDYEFEDVLTGLLGAELLTPAAQAPPRRRLRLPGFAPRRDSVMQSLPGRQDLLFVNCMSVWDLDCLDTIRDWRGQSRFAVCWIKELFRATEIGEKLLRALSRFDLVVLNFEGSVDTLSAQLPGTEVVLLPLGIDTLRFNPYPSSPPRGIDVNWVGRSDADIHRRILSIAEAEDLHYVFSSTFGGEVADHREHRVLFSAMLKRTRMFVAYPAKFNDPETTRGQEEIGYRYLEGVSAGASLIGKAPAIEGFRAMFPWDDAVTELPGEPEAIAAALQRLRKDEPGDFTRRRGVAHCLRHHDWVYRIESILQRLGLQSPDVDARLAARRDELAEQATLVEAPVIKLVRDAS